MIQMKKPVSHPAKFVILFVGRTGSTFLASAINDHTQIKVAFEPFGSSLREASEQEKWITNYFTNDEASSFRAVGFKTKLSDISAKNRFAEILRNQDVNIIHLSRHNTVKQTVSWINGQRMFQKTNRWHLYDESDRITSRLEVDSNDFALRLEKLVWGNSNLEKFVNSLKLPTLAIEYEYMIANFNSTMRKVWQFLSVGEEEVTVELKKQTADDLRSVLSDFDGLKANFVGTEYESMFDDR